MTQHANSSMLSQIADERHQRATSRFLPTIVILLCFVFWAGLSNAVASVLSGKLADTQGKAIPGATISVLRRADSSRHVTRTDQNGQFSFGSLDAGEYRLTAEFPGFAVLTRMVILSAENSQPIDLQFSDIASQNESVTVTADISDTGVFVPDPAQRVMVRDETLDANPGRPGMPISIPGMPVESPAGGVKPPQYFVPGVAGDHGEPIAMFFQVGGYLFQNNLPANAHGNGYTDPNVIIPVAIDSIETDGGAFNVREGNNSENAAIVFGLRDRLEPMVRLTAEHRDLNLVAGWSPADPANKAWLGAEVSLGNGNPYAEQGTSGREAPRAKQDMAGAGEAVRGETGTQQAARCSIGFPPKLLFPEHGNVQKGGARHIRTLSAQCCSRPASSLLLFTAIWPTFGLLLFGFSFDFLNACRRIYTKSIEKN